MEKIQTFEFGYIWIQNQLDLESHARSRPYPHNFQREGLFVQENRLLESKILEIFLLLYIHII